MIPAASGRDVSPSTTNTNTHKHTNTTPRMIRKHGARQGERITFKYLHTRLSVFQLFVHGVFAFSGPVFSTKVCERQSGTSNSRETRYSSDAEQEDEYSDDVALCLSSDRCFFFSFLKVETFISTGISDAEHDSHSFTYIHIYMTMRQLHISSLLM